MTQQNQNPNQPSNSGFTFRQKIILFNLMLTLALVAVVFIAVWQFYQPSAPQVIVVTATPQLILPTAANTPENSASKPTAILKMEVVETVLPNGTHVLNYSMTMPDGSRVDVPTRDLTAIPLNNVTPLATVPPLATRIFAKLTPLANGEYGFPLPDGSFQVIPKRMLDENAFRTPQPATTATYEAVVGNNYLKYLGIFTPDISKIPTRDIR